MESSSKEPKQKGMETGVKLGLGCLAVLAILSALLVLGAVFGNSTSTKSNISSVATQGTSSIGLYEITSDNYIGSKSRSYFDKLSGYVAQEDKEAFNQALSRGLANETCVLFKKGEKVYLVDTSVVSSVIKVRRTGETTEYWTNREAIR